jgi:hypothetical protein
MLCGLYLATDEQLVSQNGKHKLLLQGDGNFVLYRTDEGRKFAIWSSGTNGPDWAQNNSVKAILEEDGNLRLLSSQNTQKWHSNTAGSKDTVLTVRNDGNVVITSGSNLVWQTGTIEREELDTLRYGENCIVDEAIYSPNKKFRFVYQGDGNLVLYDENNGVAWTANCKNTGLETAGKMTMNEDGKLTIINGDGKVKWQSDFSYAIEKKTPYLKVRNDGQIVIYDNKDNVLWQPRIVGASRSHHIL